MSYELDDPDLALLDKARRALAEENLGALDHDDIAALIQLVNDLTQECNDALPEWPLRVTYISQLGYVVWRDVFEGRDVDPRRFLPLHQVAVFVAETDAIDYCRYRNARTLIAGHDGVDA